MITRRALLAAGTLPVFGCSLPPPELAGGFTGIAVERGHLLRAPPDPRPPDVTRRVQVLVVGGGVAGLAATRALRLAGREDFALLELEDEPGGNSRGGRVDGLACPLGAHYLPVPGDDAHEVQDLLEEFGLRQRVAGRWQYDELHLCHSPQERLYMAGTWQDGLLPMQGVGPATLAQYARFAQAVDAASRAARFVIPAFRAGMPPAHAALAAQTFAQWLDAQGLDDAHLRWYLDYCCRDDYGAGLASVSAWAGLHYFASRHGFQAPRAEGDASAASASAATDGLLTWPEGNAWLTRRLAAPLAERSQTARTVLRIAEAKHGVEVDVFDHRTQRRERWLCDHCVVALPLFIAARIVDNAPAFLRAADAATPHAPWLVANLHIREPLQDRPGAPPSWDNALYGSRGLGYVDAGHQSLDPRPAPTVLSFYRAFGDQPNGRRSLLEQPWTAWRDALLAEFSVPHPDLRAKAVRMDITRYGHAMAIPVPRAAPSAWPAVPREGRLWFAHADWAGYSIFEEAFTRGHLAGTAIAAAR